MRFLLACTCLTPVSLLALSSAVHAERVVSTKETAPISTATATAGAPDSVKVTSAGSLVLTGGTAITLNSNNNVANEGTLQITGASNATGILANPGVSANITNSGTIKIDEDYTATDTDKDGDVDGPFAQGSNRFGIRVAPGGTFTGNISSTGPITIEGNDSAAVAVDSRLQGALTVGGTVTVTGDRSVAVRAGDVTGNVTINGAISATGANARGIDLSGDVGGRLTLQGAVTSTGYRSTVRPADTSKLDADDLLQGGPAVRVAGNVAGGILLDIPPADNNKDDADEDDDGTPDANEGRANIISYGSAAALEIGAADRDVTVGAVAGDANGHGLVIRGAIGGSGIYDGVSGNGLVIGGQGRNVTIAGGMTVSGNVAAASADVNATAVRIGAGAAVPEIRNSGTISASGSAKAGTLAAAILIDQGADVFTIRNSGTISATSGKDGSAAAILDRSGEVDLVENSGVISGSGATAGAGRDVAIDLSANAAGAVVRQTQAAQNAQAPRITGSLLFGSGNDLLDVADGNVSGAVQFGAGANQMQLSGDAVYSGTTTFGAGNDRLSLAGTSSFTGAANFGGGADVLELSGTAVFRGSLSNTAGLAAQVNGGLLDVTNLGTVALASLNVSASGALGIAIDGAAGTNTLFNVAGTAAFANGADVRVQLANVSDSEGRYVFVRAGTLTGAAGVELTAASLPFLFKGRLDSATAGELAVVVERRTAAELGLNGSESRAYSAVFDVLDADADVARSFLAINDGAAFRSTLRQMLPDHAGGAFDAVTQGSRATARFLADPSAPIADYGGWGVWLQQVAWGSSKGIGDTASYDITGWGTSGGVEVQAGGIGNFGLSLAYLNGEDSDGDTDNQVRAEQFELAAHWRGQWGPVRAFARGSAAMVQFDGTRFFTGQVGDATISREANGEWDGQLYSAALGASYELDLGRISLRPLVSVDYYRLSEDGYTETGGGDAFNLTVDGRTSDELALNTTLTAAIRFGGREADAGWLRTELEAGRRQILAGELGATTARFEDGDPFTLLPEERTDGWVGRLRVIGGAENFSIGGEASAEEQQGRAALAFRVSLRFGI